MNLKKIAKCVIAVFALGFILGSWDFKPTKQSKLDKYYFNELRIWCGGILSEDAEVRKKSESIISETEANMVEDGYNRAKIREIFIKAFDKATKEKEMLDDYKNKKTNQASVK